MTGSYLSEIVREHIHCFENAELITPPSQKYDQFNLDEGYKVGHELHKWRCETGHRSVGRKIGFTNKSIWKEHGLGTPIWAHMYDDTVRFATDNRAEMSLSGRALPRIEPEIVFKLRETPIPTSAPVAAILRCVEWYTVGFEIVDAHFPDWHFSPADAVADFGVHSSLVIGAPAKIDEQRTEDLSRQLEQFHVTLFRNGDSVATGTGCNVLDHPALALSHLQEILDHQPTAQPLSPGDIITTGTLTPALPIAAGENWSVELSGIELPGLSLRTTT